MSNYALCVGINAYPAQPLTGAVNDATDWAAALAGKGYEVELLLDGDATRANMIDALTAMISRARFRDRLVFTDAMHGTFVPDLDGTETDHLDEALCPVDVATAGPIVDDDIGALFATRRNGVRAVIVSDSCYSGGLGARALLDPEPPGTPRFLPPGELPPPVPAELPPRRGVKVRPTMLLTACQEFEVAYDANVAGRPCGAFTRPAVDYLAATEDPTWFGVFAAARAVLPSKRWPQTPQVEATRGQRHWKVA